MRLSKAERARLKSIYEARTGAKPGRVVLRSSLLEGGLEAAAVVRVELTSALQPARIEVVLKRLRGKAAREAAVYESLASAGAASIAPEMLGVESSDQEVTLFLESIEIEDPWPWPRPEPTRAVVELLASLHILDLGDLGLPEWDYDDELEARSRELLTEVESSRAILPDARRSMRPLQRLAHDVRRLRRELISFSGRAFIHGDVHPGNVLFSEREAPRPVLIDWGRARSGSFLEDLSSWLQTLAYFEPEARRKHDTLLKIYLERRGSPMSLSRELRDAYWLAAASNALSGALAHHLANARATPSAEARARSMAAAADWLRIIRRADAVWS